MCGLQFIVVSANLMHGFSGHGILTFSSGWQFIVAREFNARIFLATQYYLAVFLWPWRGQDFVVLTMAWSE
jgi:hypothetical protein